MQEAHDGTILYTDACSRAASCIAPGSIVAANFAAFKATGQQLLLSIRNLLQQQLAADT
jgi:hypothetical protein